ncbi:MAG: DUF87 domain-containing protein [Paludibacteraceae bacterium]|nr:DUF87 domain-containing protein [Paludibacteraceae bacterium]
MKVDDFKINIAASIEGLNERILDVKTLIEQRINLNEYSDAVRPVVLTMSTVYRFCLLVGLSDKTQRRIDDFADYSMKVSNTPYATTFFTKNQIGSLFEALIKMRYHDIEGEWTQKSFVSRVVGREILRGREILLQEGILDEWLYYSPLKGKHSGGEIPELNLRIGMYDDEMEAKLDINSRAIPNTQILVAGATGSGKSNLLAVLLREIRSASSETSYPVNFLLFDYKGEFSDPANVAWLNHFDADTSCLLNPMERPLPFTPFKDFVGKTQNELNLYSSSMATALSAIDSTRISANMSDTLSRAIIEAYKTNGLRPITFQMILDNYNKLLPEKKREETDSVKSVLNQLIRSNLFSETDKIDLVNTCNIINLGQFEKNGPIAKAIVYFVISKLNNIYEQLPKQDTNADRVELRHFTIIDEAHYMLGFENKPLQNLIAVGRNKGMSIILATQNMASFKSGSFDFYANAQYPLIMKQQTIDNQVIKDLFGVSGSQLEEIRKEIASLQKGELIIKNNEAVLLGIGKPYKKIKVSHLI